MKLLIFQQLLEFVKNNLQKNRHGQTLVLLLIFILVAITIATTSVSILISNAQSIRESSQSMEAYYAAEAGIENAVLQLLRNPEYTGETLYITDSVNAVIVVTKDSQYEIISTGTSGIFSRIIQANVNYTNNVLSVTSWKELYK